MNTELWQRIEELFRSVVDRPGAEREIFLARICDGDDELRCEVLSLIAWDTAEDFFLRPIASAARSLTARPESDLTGGRATRGEDNQSTRQTISHLIELYKVWDKPGKANLYRARPHTNPDKSKK